MNDLLFFCTNNTNKLENKNQIEEEKPKHKLLHTEQNSAIEFTYAFSERVFFCWFKMKKRMLAQLFAICHCMTNVKAFQLEAVGFDDF